MKNKAKSLALAMVLATTSVMASSDNLQKIRKLNIFQQQGLQINTIKEHDSLYQVKGIAGGKNPFSAYITKDFKEVVFGKGFDTTTKQPLMIPIDSEKYKKNAEYTIGT